MDYFPKGNLENVLAKYREKKEVIDEEVSIDIFPHNLIYNCPL